MSIHISNKFWRFAQKTKGPTLQKKMLILCFILALIGLCLRVYVSYLPVSNYPFSVSWSESGRIFNAYQFYAPWLSKAHQSLPWLDAGRAILDGLILLIPGSQIWMWRFWIASLYLVTSFFTSFLVITRSSAVFGANNRTQNLLRWVLILWGGLFLYQSHIYYHLLAGIIPVLWFTRKDRPSITLLVVAVCAVWMGLTRVNWFIMPAIVAATIYFLTEPKEGKSIFQYVRWPMVWGMINLIISGAVYLLALNLAGKPSVISGAMNYAFFRSKLWPNAGFAPGLIPGIILITLPVLIIILYVTWRHGNPFHWVRWGAVLSIITVLGAGSTVVSLRSGGGYDLHNYDTLLLILFLTAVYLGQGGFSPDRVIQPAKPILFDPRFAAMLLLLPVLLTAMQVKPRPVFATAESAQAISQLDQVIRSQTPEQANSVLFIDHRQLLIYNQIPSVTLHAPYENIELMEMAMANNKVYFSQFWTDLENRKFPFIVSSVLWEGMNDSQDHYFWYENNVWSDYVVSPILRHYEPIYINTEVGLAIYAPKR
jgi:hypothetical protein